MILQRAGNDLGRRSGGAVHHHHHRIALAAVIGTGVVILVRLGAAAMAHHQVVLLQEVARHLDAFIQQAAGIAAQIEHQAFDVVLAQLA